MFLIAAQSQTPETGSSPLEQPPLHAHPSAQKPYRSRLLPAASLTASCSPAGVILECAPPVASCVTGLTGSVTLHSLRISFSFLLIDCLGLLSLDQLNKASY